MFFLCLVQLRTHLWFKPPPGWIHTFVSWLLSWAASCYNKWRSHYHDHYRWWVSKTLRLKLEENSWVLKEYRIGYWRKTRIFLRIRLEQSWFPPFAVALSHNPGRMQTSYPSPKETYNRRKWPLTPNIFDSCPFKSCRGVRSWTSLETCDIRSTKNNLVQS